VRADSDSTENNSQDLIWKLLYIVYILTWLTYSMVFFAVWILTGWPYALFGAGLGISTVVNLIWNQAKRFL
jgi:hypothetical protein